MSYSIVEPLEIQCLKSLGYESMTNPFASVSIATVNSDPRVLGGQKIRSAEKYKLITGLSYSCLKLAVQILGCTFASLLTMYLLQ